MLVVQSVPQKDERGEGLVRHGPLKAHGLPIDVFADLIRKKASFVY